MEDQPGGADVGALIAALATRSELETQRLASLLRHRTWPGGVADRPEPAALEGGRLGGAAPGVVAEPGGHERGPEVVAVAHPDRLAVQLGARAARGPERLVPRGIVDDAREGALAVLQRHAHAPLGEAVEVVGGPVER